MKEARDLNLSVASARREMMDIFFSNEEVVLYGPNIGSWWIGETVENINKDDIVIGGFSEYKDYYLNAVNYDN